MGEAQSTMRKRYPGAGVNRIKLYNSRPDDRIALSVNSILRAAIRTIAAILNFILNLFRPSRRLESVAYVPVVGNVANLIAAIHAYNRGEMSYGHQKVLEAAIGTSVDFANMGSIIGGWKLAQLGISSGNLMLFCAGSRILMADLGQHTLARMSALGAVRLFMNPPYKKYDE